MSDLRLLHFRGFRKPLRENTRRVEKQFNDEKQRILVGMTSVFVGCGSFTGLLRGWIPRATTGPRAINSGETKGAARTTCPRIASFLMWPTIRNLGVFQALWFLLVLGGDTYVVIAIAWVLFHLMVCLKS